MIRAVIFDFNGVLVDDESVHFELFREVLAQEGVAITERDYHERYLGYDDRGCFAAALGDAGQAFDDAPARRADRAEGPALCRGGRGGPALFPRRGRDPGRPGRALAGGDLLGGAAAGDRVRPEPAGPSRPGRGHRLGRGRPQVQARPRGLPAGPRRPARPPPVHDAGRSSAARGRRRAWWSRTAWPGSSRPRGPGCGPSASPTPTPPPSSASRGRRRHRRPGRR